MDAFLLDQLLRHLPPDRPGAGLPRRRGDGQPISLAWGRWGRTGSGRNCPRLIESIQENRFTPICLKKDGKPADFTYCPIRPVRRRRWSACRYDSFSALMDDFYALRERQERVRQRGADLIRTATTARDRLRRKLAMQEKDYAADPGPGPAADLRRPDHRQPLPDGAGAAASWRRRISMTRRAAHVPFPWTRC